jgi:hypothetical protein
MMGQSIDQAKSKMKLAYLNYLLLSPFVQRDHFPSDQRIKKNFRTAILSLIASTPYRGDKVTLPVKAVQRDEIKRLLTEIDQELIGALIGPQ